MLPFSTYRNQICRITAKGETFRGYVYWTGQDRPGQHTDHFVALKLAEASVLTPIDEYIYHAVESLLTDPSVRMTRASQLNELLSQRLARLATDIRRVFPRAGNGYKLPVKTVTASEVTQIDLMDKRQIAEADLATVKAEYETSCAQKGAEHSDTRAAQKRMELTQQRAARCAAEVLLQEDNLDDEVLSSEDDFFETSDDD